MKKLDKVIAGLECCADPECEDCEYNGRKCITRLLTDALDVLRDLDGKYRAAVEMAAIATERAAARSGGDLISRSALLTEIEENLWSIDIDELKAILEYVPAVEAEPIVHAHWIERAGGTHNVCSNCHTGVPVVVSVKGWLRCCICGAHMDEEVADG